MNKRAIFQRFGRKHLLFWSFFFILSAIIFVLFTFFNSKNTKENIIVIDSKSNLIEKDKFLFSLGENLLSGQKEGDVAGKTYIIDFLNCRLDVKEDPPSNFYCDWSDCNKDGAVNAADLVLVQSNIGRSDCDYIYNGWCGGSDINRDGQVSIADFMTVQRNFGRNGCS